MVIGFVKSPFVRGEFAIFGYPTLSFAEAPSVIKRRENRALSVPFSPAPRVSAYERVDCIYHFGDTWLPFARVSLYAILNIKKIANRSQYPLSSLLREWKGPGTAAPGILSSPTTTGLTNWLP